MNHLMVWRLFVLGGADETLDAVEQNLGQALPLDFSSQYGAIHKRINKATSVL